MNLGLFLKFFFFIEKKKKKTGNSMQRNWKIALPDFLDVLIVMVQYQNLRLTEGSKLKGNKKRKKLH